MKLLFMLVAMLIAKISFGQKILGINLKGNPKELTGYELEYFVGLEKYVLKKMGNQSTFLPLNFNEGHLSQQTEDYLDKFGLTEVKIQYPLGISMVPLSNQLTFFNQMRPKEIYLHTNLEANTELAILYKWFFQLKGQMIKDLGAPEFEQSDENGIFLRWLGLDYQIILFLDKNESQKAINLSYFPK